jgi:hypothetical protein
MAMPVPPDERSSRVIRAVFDLFFAYGHWPRFADLDRYMDQRGEPDTEAVLVGMPSGLAYGVGMRPIRNDQQVGLTVAGLAACPNAAEDLDIFLRVVRFAADLERTQLAGEPDPELTSVAVARKVQLPAAGRADLVKRVGAMLETEQWGWSQASRNQDGGWSFVVSRRVRPLRGVANLTDYWNTTRGHADTTGSDLDLAPDQAVRVRAWVELHGDVPRLVIVNASEAEVRDVVPTLSLSAHSDDGEPLAMVGGGQLGRVAELSPGSAFVAELSHLGLWSGSNAVESALHVEFDDTRGQRWQLAHGKVQAITREGAGVMRTAEGRIIAARSLDLSQPVSSFVSSNDGRAAFVSYVHQDAARVDDLQMRLEAAGITVWRDLDRMLPGENKRQRIVDAIRRQSFAFLSCHSSARASRSETYANEELSVALEVLRTHSNASWFIPVRFDDTPLPTISLGHHGTLDDLIWVNLFGAQHDIEASRLIAALQRLH